MFMHCMNIAPLFNDAQALATPRLVHLQV